MASTSLFWSDLPGIPRKMKWPIKVVEWESPVQNKVLVYNMSDDAYFRVDKKQLKEFPGDLEKLKEIGIVALRRKKNVQEAFVKDIHWALNIQPQEYVSDTTDNEEDTISEIFPILFELVFDSEQGFITETENITAEETALNADALAELEGCIDEDGYIPDSGEDTEMDHNVFDFEDEPPKRKQKKGPVRQKWSAEELIELKTFFRENLETNITPGLKQCQRVIALSKEQNGILYKRHWETIEKKVWNLIQQKK